MVRATCFLLGFADAAFHTKVSTRDARSSGDSAHEKLALPEGETVVYMRDSDDNTVRLRFVVGQDPRALLRRHAYVGRARTQACRHRAYWPTSSACTRPMP